MRPTWRCSCANNAGGRGGPGWPSCRRCCKCAFVSVLLDTTSKLTGKDFPCGIRPRAHPRSARDNPGNTRVIPGTTHPECSSWVVYPLQFSSWVSLPTWFFQLGCFAQLHLCTALQCPTQHATAPNAALYDQMTPDRRTLPIPPPGPVHPRLARLALCGSHGPTRHWHPIGM